MTLLQDVTPIIRQLNACFTVFGWKEVTACYVSARDETDFVYFVFLA